MQKLDDRYALVEVKLGSKEIIHARDNLSELEHLISEKGYRKPSFKMILTGGKNAMSLPCSYKGKQFDDAFLIPIGCLTL